MYVRVLISIAILAAFVAADVVNKKYCDLKSCKGKPNTACLYSPKITNQVCGNVRRIGLNAAEKQEIVDVHNYYRNFVASGKERRGNPGPQPAAKDMKRLVWDDELAMIAQSWANQCNFNHDPCRNTPEVKVGQNLAEASQYGSKPATLKKMITDWYDEVNDFDRRTVGSLSENNFSAVGHYTQMVWANTTKIGCGIIDYQNDPPWETRYLACNYGPAGNIYNTPIYTAV